MFQVRHIWLPEHEFSGKEYLLKATRCEQFTTCKLLFSCSNWKQFHAWGRGLILHWGQSSPVWLNIAYQSLLTEESGPVSRLWHLCLDSFLTFLLLSPCSCSIKDAKNSLSRSSLPSGTPRVAPAEKELEAKQGILHNGIKDLTLTKMNEGAGRVNTVFNRKDGEKHPYPISIIGELLCESHLLTWNRNILIKLKRTYLTAPTVATFCMHSSSEIYFLMFSNLWSTLCLKDNTKVPDNRNIVRNFYQLAYSASSF